MTAIIRCNGPRFGAPEFSADTLAWLMPVIRESRRYYPLGEEQLNGVRFNDDNLVLLSLRSNATEEQVKLAPLSWVRAALEDCASRDHWYSSHGDKRWLDENEDFGGEG